MKATYTFYTNIIKMVKHREYDLISSPLEEKDFLIALTKNDYVSVTGYRKVSDTRNASKICAAILISKSRFEQKTDNMKTLIKILNDEANSIAGEAPTEIVVVTHDPLPSHIKKYIREQTNVETYETKKFIVDITKYCAMMQHTIATAEDIKTYCDNMYLTPNRFPHILIDDTPIIWLGAKAGTCIKIMRLSETAGYAYDMRICTDN